VHREGDELWYNRPWYNAKSFLLLLCAWVHACSRAAICDVVSMVMMDVALTCSPAVHLEMKVSWLGFGGQKVKVPNGNVLFGLYVIVFIALMLLVAWREAKLKVTARLLWLIWPFGVFLSSCHSTYSPRDGQAEFLLPVWEINFLQTFVASASWDNEKLIKLRNVDCRGQIQV